MKKHFQYLWYVLRHKWFVFIECCKFGIPWRGITHDLSKFRWSEWRAYVDYFYGPFGVHYQDMRPRNGAHYLKHQIVCAKFDRAWLLHQHRNPHHWQYWLLQEDDPHDGVKVVRMPHRLLKEMLADWIGAGKATGFLNTMEWYQKHRDTIMLHEMDHTWLFIQLRARGGDCAK